VSIFDIKVPQLANLTQTAVFSSFLGGVRMEKASKNLPQHHLKQTKSLFKVDDYNSNCFIKTQVFIVKVEHETKFKH